MPKAYNGNNTKKQGKNYKFLPCFFVALYRPVCPIGHIVYLWTWTVAVTGLFFGPSDWNRTSGLLNPILFPWLSIVENKEISQLFRAFAIFRIAFISHFPYIPLAFRLYSASVVGEERVTTQPSLERILLHPLSNIRKLAHQYKQSLFGKDGFVGNQR